MKRERDVALCARYDNITGGLANHIGSIDLNREIRGC